MATSVAAPIYVDALPAGATAAWAPLRVKPDEVGFQERCLAAGADELLLGGAKGPGKSDVLIAMPLRWAHKEAFAAAFVRESYKELLRVLDRAHAVYSKLPRDRRPAWNGDTKRFTWPSRAFVQFGYARVKKDLTWTQGGNWAAVYYDEVGNQPDEGVVNTLISEIRCPDPTIRRQFAGSANPGFAGHAWVKRRFVVPCGKKGERVAWSKFTLPNGRIEYRSKQFVPGRVTDNPIYANDAAYMVALMTLPERMQKCLLWGDWDAATGAALDELEPSVHLVKPFECPAHWPYVAAFDWGYAHPWWFGWGRVSDDGRIFVCDTVRGRLDRDWDIASKILDRVPREALRGIHAGHDCWNEIKARGENAPETAGYFMEQGIQLTQANVSRVSGYNNLIRYLAWRETDFMPQRQPMLQFFDTPTNRVLVEEHLPTMVMDPDNPTDVLKVNADADDGAGGDDGYDMLRYLCASRPMKAETQSGLIKRSAWDPDVLRREAEKFARPVSTPMGQRRGGGPIPGA